MSKVQKWIAISSLIVICIAEVGAMIYLVCNFWNNEDIFVFGSILFIVANVVWFALAKMITDIVWIINKREK